MPGERKTKTKEPAKPEPFDEEQVEDPWWAGEDPWDKLLPKTRGFITDIVYAYRETEVPTIYCIWAALFAIAAVIKRDAWVKWFRGKQLFASFYLFLVGPPSTKKSFILDETVEMLEELDSGLKREISKKLKSITVLNEATPEYLLDELSKLSDIVIELPSGKKKSPGACSVIAASELSRFLGKQRYNEGKISLLINLYDAKNRIRIGTLSRGAKILRNVHTMFIGATTKSGLSDSVPEASMGDGFLSRTVIVNLEKTHRRRALPDMRPVEGAPSKYDLIASLGWIAENVTGEHTFSEEARECYQKWYGPFKDTIEELGEDVAPVFSRIDLDVVKIALLFKAQRYSLSQTIEKEDVEEAIKLLEATVKTSPDVVLEVGGDDLRKTVNRASNYIRKKGKVNRATLMRNTTLVASELKQALGWLLEAGKINVWQNGKMTNIVMRESTEVYEWKSEDGPPEINNEEE